MIDEISMLSLKTFEQLEVVCRVARGQDRYFGGLQVVLFGDFYQLPPVGNPLYNDEGKFCFESLIFCQYITHKVNLKTVVRQDDDLLIKAVRETALGCVSDEVDVFLKSLQRPIPENIQPIHLFPKNIDTTIFNNECLKKVNTEEKVYKATKNCGSEKYLRKIIAPNYLNLKLDCPVILLYNLGGKLVNGLQGTVKKFEDDAVHVHFSSIHETHRIQRRSFTKYSLVENRNIAEREQFPLTLGYGLTIHKAQGMTLDSVFVHCKGIFQAGQLSVGIGRCVSPTNLFLSDYRKGLCPQPKPLISKFYGEQSQPLLPDLSCCKSIQQQSIYTNTRDPEIQYDSDSSAFDLEDLEFIDQDDYELPSYINVTQLQFISYTDNPVSDTQKQINEICSKLDRTRLINFCCSQHRRIKGVLSDELVTKTTPTKEWTSILSAHHLYLTSTEYAEDLKLLFGHSKTSDNHVQIGSEIILDMVKSVVDNLAEKVSKHPEQTTPFTSVDMSDPGKSKIRHVAGMCIAKVRNHYMNVIIRNIGNPEVSVQTKVKEAQTRVQILNEMIADMDACDAEKDKTLEEIERKQNIRKSLTYVNDNTFQFFIHLNMEIQQRLNFESLRVEKEHIFESAKSSIEKNEDLQKLFFKLFADIEESYIIRELYKEVLHKYMMVSHKQLLKDTRDRLNLEKKKAHREEISKKKEKRKAEVNISMKDILNDMSEKKESSHLKLKVNSMSSKDFLSNKDFTKNDLFRLCGAYGVPYTVSMKKEDIASALRQQIVTVSCMVNVDALAGSVAQPSTSQEFHEKPKKRRTRAPYKGKGKGKGKSSVKKYYCKVCKEEYMEDEEWICCDDCENWYHRMCGGDLSDDEYWESLQAEDTKWSCLTCKQ